MKAVHAPKREIGGMPLRWGSPDGLIHACEGDQMVAGDSGTFLLWTICGQHDVPANAGVRSRAIVTCPECAETKCVRCEDAMPAGAASLSGYCETCATDMGAA